LVTGKSARLLILTFFVFSLGISPSVVLADQSGAAAAISDAQSQIVVCYEAAKEAEAAGANVTGLADVLNDAGVLLSDAEAAFSRGDFDLAQSLAVESSVGLEGFVSDADALRDAAVQAENFDFWLNVVGSMLGVFVVIGVGVAVWFWGKKHYAPHDEGELGWKDAD